MGSLWFEVCELSMPGTAPNKMICQGRPQMNGVTWTTAGPLRS